VANTKSAQKAMRQAERRAARNQAARSAVRTYVKKANEAVSGTAVDNAAEVVRVAVSALDKAARKGIVHRNAAARRKSRLMARLHQLSLAPETPVVEEEATTGRGRRGAAARGATGDKKPAARKAAPKRTTSKKS
jgi:small subunit ribosomal protein S20